MTSTPTPTPTPTEPPTPPADPASPPADPPEPTEPDDKATAGKGKEAAKYRTRLRETEAARDNLATRLEALQRAEVTRLAGSTLHVGEDVFTLGGIELAELLGDDGEVDPAAVNAVAARIAKDRPGVAREPRDYGQGRRGTPSGKGSDWTAAFKRS